MRWVGSRQPRYYVQSSVALSDRDSWSLSSDYRPTANSLQNAGKRVGSDTEDWRVNAKIGYTPNVTNKYTLNYTKQSGEKGAPLNVYNNPPVPPNSYWRWPWWDVQNTSLLTTTQLGAGVVFEGEGPLHYVYKNALDAFDDGTVQDAIGQRSVPQSVQDDHAYGTSLEFGTTPVAANTIKTAFHYRTDVHTGTADESPHASHVEL